MIFKTEKKCISCFSAYVNVSTIFTFSNVVTNTALVFTHTLLNHGLSKVVCHYIIKKKIVKENIIVQVTLEIYIQFII